MSFVDCFAGFLGQDVKFRVFFLPSSQIFFVSLDTLKDIICCLWYATVPLFIK